MKSKHILTTLAVVLLGTAIQAQTFLTPLTSISGNAELTTTNQQHITGKIVAAMIGMKGLNSLSIKDQQGEKHKFKAEEVQNLKIKVDKLAKLEMIAEKTSNLEKMMDADFDELNDRDYIYYERIQVPGKNQYVLVQLLNPGFSDRIKVFDKPGAKTGETSVGGIAVSGNDFKALYIMINGEVKEIKKSKYKKQDFPMLFGDCKKMVDFYKKPDFGDFAEHILFYDLNCKSTN